MKIELWREIPGHPNVLTSNLGRVNRIYKNSEHLIKGSVNRHGYVTTLYVDGRHQQMHRLIALAWQSKPHVHCLCRKVGERTDFYWLNGYDENTLRSVWGEDYLIPDESDPLLN